MSKSKRKKRRRTRPSPAAGAGASQPAPAQAKQPEPAKAKRVGKPLDERPPAPWGSFPLVELVVLAGLICLVAGAIVGGSRGLALVISGLVLASLGGLELSVREHFAGFRSHTTLLAGFPAMVTLGFLFYLAPGAMPPPARFAVGAVVFAACYLALRRVFQRRAGVAFKLR